MATYVNSGDVEADDAATLFKLALDRGLEPFRDTAKRLYATFAVNGHKEHHPLKSPAIRVWLQRIGYANTGLLPKRDVLSQVMDSLEADALFNGPEHSVYVRLAEHEGAIYLDLADSDWQAIKITAADWEIVHNPPVKFRRPRGLLPLPPPLRGGSVTEVLPFLNVKPGSDALKLIVAWLLGALRGRGPYVILGIYGEHGSAKSTAARVCRRLIDPNTSDLRGDPHEVRDLMIAANNGHVLNFDNLSTIRPWLSDAFCRLSTGGGFATRELYSDDQEILIDAQRPLILNSIVDVFERADLLDRAIVIRLEDLPDTQRRTESDFWTDFAAAQPRILGALLDAVVVALREEPTMRLASLPRMADFARWVCAAESALPWKCGDFLTAYEANRARAVVALLDDDPVAGVVRQMLQSSAGWWEGTATQLLQRLQSPVEAISKFEKDPRKATAALKRLTPALRTIGIEISAVEKHGGRKHICLMDSRRISG